MSLSKSEDQYEYIEREILAMVYSLERLTPIPLHVPQKILNDYKTLMSVIKTCSLGYKAVT